MPFAKRSRWFVVGVVGLGLLALAVGAVQFDWCGDWAAPTDVVTRWTSAADAKVLRAGFARVSLRPPFPSPLAGYGPPRQEASSSAAPLEARVVVLESGGKRFGIVSLDLLSAPEDMAVAIRESVKDLGLDGLWVAATHSHSSFGGYDSRAFAQVVGMGRFDADARAAVVEASSAALREAMAKLVPARLSWGEGTVPTLVRARSGERPDERVTRLRFEHLVETGDAMPVVNPKPVDTLVPETPKDLGQVLVLAAHPTLLGRGRNTLHSDYPAVLAAREEAAGKGVTVVLQGAIGNTSAVVPEASVASSLVPGAAVVDAKAGTPVGASPEELNVERYVEALQAALSAVALEPVAGAASSTPSLTFTRMRLGLPRPDLSRTAPSSWLRRPAENALCADAERTVELSRLSLGPVHLLAAPFEVSRGAASLLEADARVMRVVSLVDGYSGYLEPSDAVLRNEGEAKRQYFSAELMERLRTVAKALPTAK